MSIVAAGSPAATAVAGRTIVGASVVGHGHVRAGLECQDAFRVLERDGSLVIAVADGLGSASRSELGAVVATEAAAARATRIADHDPAVAAAEAMIAARDALEAIAGAEGCVLADLACTLIVAVIAGGRIAIAHIGDGAAVGLRGNEACVLSPPGASEYLNEVDPLTGDDWDEHVRWLSGVGGIDAIALFTDGCQHAALRRVDGSLRAHAGFFGPLVDYARSGVSSLDGSAALEQLLAGPKMNEHSDDDKTLVLAVL